MICMLTLNMNIFTLHVAAVEKYCNKHVCVCLSVSKSPESQARSLPSFLCILPIAVALYSSDGVTQSQGKWTILGVFFSIENALCELYSGMNFATKDRCALNLRIDCTVGQNSFPDIKGHNCDLTIAKLLAK